MYHHIKLLKLSIECLLMQVNCTLLNLLLFGVIVGVGLASGGENVQFPPVVTVTVMSSIQTSLPYHLVPATPSNII